MKTQDKQQKREKNKSKTSKGGDPGRSSLLLSTIFDNHSNNISKNGRANAFKNTNSNGNTLKPLTMKVGTVIPMSGRSTYLTGSLKDSELMKYCNFLKSNPDYLNHVRENKTKFVSIYNRGFFNMSTRDIVPFDSILETSMTNHTFCDQSIINELDAKVFVASMVFPSDMNTANKDAIYPIIENKQTGGVRFFAPGSSGSSSGNSQSSLYHDTGSETSGEYYSVEEFRDPSVHIADTDERRTVVSIKVHEYYDKPKKNFGMYILKHSNNDEYTSGYLHEALVYDCFNSNAITPEKRNFLENNVVMKFNSGIIKSRNSLPLETALEDAVEIIDMPRNSVFLLLANTYNYCDFDQFIIQKYKFNSDNRNYFLGIIQNTFIHISNIILQANTKFNFFHGDLHCGNIKVKSVNEVLLFDFDFSGHLNNYNCYKPSFKNRYQFNFELYPLKNFVYTGIKSLNKRTLLQDTSNDDLKRKIMYLFDVLRLYIHMFIELSYLYKKNNQQQLDLKELNRPTISNLITTNLINVFGLSEPKIYWESIELKSKEIFKKKAWNKVLQSPIVFNTDLITGFINEYEIHTSPSGGGKGGKRAILKKSTKKILSGSRV
jgi:hypothetical protein